LTGTFLIKVQLSNETSAALSGSPVALIEGHMNFQTTSPVREMDNSQQPVSDPSESKKARLIGRIGSQTDSIDAKGDIEIECDCGHAITISASELEWEETEAFERAMGAERAYVGKVDWECSNCNAEISVAATVSEYPMGTINHAEWEVKCGTLLQAPELEIKGD
jgi:hypothetical protein